MVNRISDIIDALPKDNRILKKPSIVRLLTFIADKTVEIIGDVNSKDEALEVCHHNNISPIDEYARDLMFFKTVHSLMRVGVIFSEHVIERICTHTPFLFTPDNFDVNKIDYSNTNALPTEGPKLRVSKMDTYYAVILKDIPRYLCFANYLLLSQSIPLENNGKRILKWTADFIENNINSESNNNNKKIDIHNGKEVFNLPVYSILLNQMIHFFLYSAEIAKFANKLIYHIENILVRELEPLCNFPLYEDITASLLLLKSMVERKKVADGSIASKIEVKQFELFNVFLVKLPLTSIEGTHRSTRETRIKNLYRVWKSNKLFLTNKELVVNLNEHLVTGILDIFNRTPYTSYSLHNPFREIFSDHIFIPWFVSVISGEVYIKYHKGGLPLNMISSILCSIDSMVFLRCVQEEGPDTHHQLEYGLAEYTYDHTHTNSFYAQLAELIESIIKIDQPSRSDLMILFKIEDSLMKIISTFSLSKRNAVLDGNISYEGKYKEISITIANILYRGIGVIDPRSATHGKLLRGGVEYASRGLKLQKSS